MNKVVFLDRDGTINEDGFIYKIEHWKWLRGAKEAMKKLQAAGYKLAITTNQTGIGEGYYTEKDMHELHDYVKTELEKTGITIAAIAYSLKIGDNNEKPRVGMATQVEEIIGPIDYTNSWMVGDKEKDAQFGKNIGANTALIRSRHWQEDKLATKPDIIVDSLSEAADRIVHNQAGI